MASQHQRSRETEQHDGETRADIWRETLEEFKERSDDIRTLVTTYVKENPYRALGIALLSGVAITFFLTRR